MKINPLKNKHLEGCTLCLNTQCLEIAKTNINKVIFYTGKKILEMQILEPQSLPLYCNCFELLKKLLYRSGLKFVYTVLPVNQLIYDFIIAQKPRLSSKWSLIEGFF